MEKLYYRIAMQTQHEAAHLPYLFPLGHRASPAAPAGQGSPPWACEAGLLEVACWGCVSEPKVLSSRSCMFCHSVHLYFLLDKN